MEFEKNDAWNVRIHGMTFEFYVGLHVVVVFFVLGHYASYYTLYLFQRQKKTITGRNRVGEGGRNIYALEHVAFHFALTFYSRNCIHFLLPFLFMGAP